MDHDKAMEILVGRWAEQDRQERTAKWLRIVLPAILRQVGDGYLSESDYLEGVAILRNNEEPTR